MADPKPKEVQVRVEIVKLHNGEEPVPDIETVELDVNAVVRSEAANNSNENTTLGEQRRERWMNRALHLDLTNLRATKLPNLSVMGQLQRLVLRQNWLTNFSHVESGCPHLTELDLYENKLHRLSECSFPPDLVTLDLSFNELKHLENVGHLSHLRELYLVANKLKQMEGLEGLSKLRLLEFGSNNLRVIDGAALAHVPNLEELWLGRNKIAAIDGISHLTKLKKLSIQSNRLTTIGDGLSACVNLRELYLSHNGFTGTPIGLSNLVLLTTLDLSGNKLTTLEGAGLESLKLLQELWINNNEFETWSSVEGVFRSLSSSLNTIYLEFNPIQKIQGSKEYVDKVRACVPKLQQLDATIF